LAPELSVPRGVDDGLAPSDEEPLEHAAPAVTTNVHSPTAIPALIRMVGA
jgi:hypothetical protein